MTFGWVIALPNGRRLARCSGPAFGPFGSSFRTEGYGFLSVSRFLFHIQDFCACTDKWVIKMMTDNQGLLTRVMTEMQYETPFPNITLLLDWDITNKISQSLRNLHSSTILTHVKGHQDDHRQYCDLPLDAQLNVDADTEAGYYQCMYPAKRPLVLQLPSNGVQLHISGNVICSKVKRSIREAFSVPPYLQYIEKRFHWTRAISDTVDWQTYTQAISQF
jgi:hypothetical protein